MYTYPERPMFLTPAWFLHFLRQFHFVQGIYAHIILCMDINFSVNQGEKMLQEAHQRRPLRHSPKPIKSLYFSWLGLHSDIWALGVSLII